MSRPSWTILNYIEADNNVCSFGLHNVRAMQKVGSQDNLTIAVQLDEVHHKKTWRFKVVQGGNAEDVSLDKDMGLNPEKELPDGVAWATKKYPSTNFMLILWNHGNGILDEPKGYAPQPRGILYDYTNKTYLNNQQLERALSTIHHKVLGKKIPLLGMDACLMSMIEVCYQVQEHADILVASENIEPAPGWDYSTFLNYLTKQKQLVSPQKLAEVIVQTYHDFTRSKHRHYTLSATNLHRTEEVVVSINEIVKAIEDIAQHDPVAIQEVIAHARKNAVEFHEGKYIDLVSFYRNIAQFIKQKKSSYSK